LTTRSLGALTGWGRRVEPPEFRELVGDGLPASELRRLAQVDALLRLAAGLAWEDSGLMSVLDRHDH
jgi:hypothetical protein